MVYMSNSDLTPCRAWNAGVCIEAHDKLAILIVRSALNWIICYAHPILQAGVGMTLDRIGDHHGHHTIIVASIVKDNSVMRDGRIKVGDRIVDINNKPVEVSFLEIATKSEIPNTI